jgi:hypothetical protein
MQHMKHAPSAWLKIVAYKITADKIAADKIAADKRILVL